MGAASLVSICQGLATSLVAGYAVSTSIWIWPDETFRSANTEDGLLSLAYCITILIWIVWLSAESTLIRLVPESGVAVLASRYLQIIIISAPGYAFFKMRKEISSSSGLVLSLVVYSFDMPIRWDLLLFAAAEQHSHPPCYRRATSPRAAWGATLAPSQAGASGLLEPHVASHPRSCNVHCWNTGMWRRHRRLLIWQCSACALIRRFFRVRPCPKCFLFFF